MITLSIPVSSDIVNFINSLVKRGDASTKAEVVRQALARYAEDRAVEDVLIAEQEMCEGKGIKGDLRTILAKIK
ncbi:TPA: hypothetical protein DEP96_04030 [Candidatus Uhrbacteria bacterium]|nr:hypothetical protein [Candidatus Uhrbacteria bacterium]